MNTSRQNHDVVIIGAGVAGSAMSIVLARAGLDVLLLEKSREHKDVVRGEWLAPWGVKEAETLGLVDLYMREGAHRINRHINYSEFEDSASAEAKTLPLGSADIPNPLCLGHPTTCNLLNREAVKAGATLVRGLTALAVTPGSPPTVNYSTDGETHSTTPRWVIGADGRNGVVARQIGCELTTDPEHHLFSGMLIEDAPGWPEDLQVIATEGDTHVLAFPQGSGRVRVYLGWPKEDRGRLVGPQGPRRFLDSWQVDCVPHADKIVAATPVSPCIAYPNSDAWVDSPVRPGVVLIGDAAGRNDPITGQGLSISHRDVRMVSEALLGHQHWSTEIFAPYVTERAERMSRLRIAARLTSLREAAFGEAGKQLRASIHERMTANPDFAAPTIATLLGPENLPAEVFTPAFTEQIVGAPIWDPALP